MELHFKVDKTDLVSDKWHGLNLDYAEIEKRCLAHMSEDARRSLIEASWPARESFIFNTSARRMGKTVGYGVSDHYDDLRRYFKASNLPRWRDLDAHIEDSLKKKRDPLDETKA